MGKLPELSVQILELAKSRGRITQGYTVKEYRSTKHVGEDQWSHESIVLRPLSSDPSFQDIVISDDQSLDFRVLGIFELVLGSNNQH